MTTELTMPRSLEAESAVLGAMLLSPDACDTVTDALTEESFYSTAHQLLYREICALFDATRMADLVVLTQRLSDKGLLEQVGGAAFVTDLINHCPTTANLPHYIGIVRNKELLRRMISAGHDVVARSYESQDDDPDALLAEVLAQMQSLAEKQLKGGFTSANELVPLAMATIEAMLEANGKLLGLGTGFTDLDRMTAGLQKANMIVIAARPSMGKSQPLSAKLVTPSGFVQMCDAYVGMPISGRDGKVYEVTGVFPQGVLPVYKVTLSDGSSTRCSADHLWSTMTRNERRSGSGFTVKTCEQISSTIGRPDNGGPNHALPDVLPVEFSLVRCKLPIRPWLLGALLGDGKLQSSSVGFFKPEQDVQDRVRKLLPSGDCCSAVKGGLRIKKTVRGSSVSSVAKALDSMGLRVGSLEKYIPQQYLMASVEDRQNLLSGLLDTDGSVYNSGVIVEYSTSSKRLAKDVIFLCRSLGVRVTMKKRSTRYTYKGVKKKGADSWRMRLVFGDGCPNVMSSQKHTQKLRDSRRAHRSIISIEPDGFEQCQCISVSAPDRLYLTDDFIPTHNTALGMNIAENVAINQNRPVGIFSLEMSSEELMRRMISSQSRVNLREVAAGHGDSQRDGPKLADAAARIMRAPLYIDDTPSLTIAQLRARAHRLKKSKGIELLVIDYLQLMRSNSKKADANRQVEVSEISAGVKSLCKELDIPVIVLAQLNRKPDERGDGKPKLSDLRESGSIEQDADVVGLLIRPEVYAADDDPKKGQLKGVASLIIAKQRNGPVGDVPLTYISDFTRFENAAKVHASDVPTQ